MPNLMRKQRKVDKALRVYERSYAKPEKDVGAAMHIAGSNILMQLWENGELVVPRANLMRIRHVDSRRDGEGGKLWRRFDYYELYDQPADGQPVSAAVGKFWVRQWFSWQGNPAFANEPNRGAILGEVEIGGVCVRAAPTGA